MQKLVSELFDTYSGVAAVIGGGSTTIDDLAQLPSDCLLIAVNHHYHGQPHYMVALDEITHSMHNYNCPTVGQFDCCDYVTHDNGKPLLTSAGHKSAYKATELAIRMGASKVYLVGIDCYTGKKPYYNDEMNYKEFSQLNHVSKVAVRETDRRICADRWATNFKRYPQVVPMSQPLMEAWNRV